jgi:hypothetical protein
MTVAEQIAEIMVKYPEAWAYIETMMDVREKKGEHDILYLSLPKFDDNDEWIKEGK